MEENKVEGSVVLESEFIMPFDEILNTIPQDIIKDNIIEQLVFQARNQIMCPKKIINELNYTSVYYDGEILCYNITIPTGYIRYLDNMDDNDRKEICESIKNQLKKYRVNLVKFTQIGDHLIRTLNLWVE